MKLQQPFYIEPRTDDSAKGKKPEKFLVKGSMEFMKYLYENGVKNYFVTGAVVDKTVESPMGMYEEVLGLVFEIISDYTPFALKEIFRKQ